MSARVSPIAPFGSLLKRQPGRNARCAEQKKTNKRNSVNSQRKRERDAKHLALVRRLPCISCDNDPAGVAAHVRMTRAGKPISGTGNKPGDQWTLPLCPKCHTDGPQAQHIVGEVPFWRDLGLDPLVIAQRVYAASPDVEAMRAVIFTERERRK